MAVLTILKNAIVLTGWILGTLFLAFVGYLMILEAWDVIPWVVSFVIKVFVISLLIVTVYDYLKQHKSGR